MRQFVVDASVVIKWYLPEEHADEAGTLLSPDCELCAPDLLFAEVGNILWKRAVKKELSADKAHSIMEALQAVPLTIWEHRLLADAALTVACRTGRSYYDSLYVALALTVDRPLVTADRKLHHALVGVPQLGKRLVWVGDLAAEEL